MSITTKKIHGDNYINQRELVEYLEKHALNFLVQGFIAQAQSIACVADFVRMQEIEELNHLRN